MLLYNCHAFMTAFALVMLIQCDVEAGASKKCCMLDTTSVCLQVVLNPLQQTLAQGCHLTRDTLSTLLEEARDVACKHP